MGSAAQAFIDTYSPDAQVAAAQTGVPWQTILAQWADETGFGTAPAFTTGNNFAGISPGGNVAAYPDQISGLAAYISTLNQPTYATVRNAAAQGPLAAAAALGQSPWAASHYDANQTGQPGIDLGDIMAETGLVSADELTKKGKSFWGRVTDPGNIFGGAVNSIPGVGPAIGAVVPPVAGAVGGEAANLAQGVATDILGALRQPALLAVGLTAAGALIIGGVWTFLKPVAGPAVDGLKDKAQQAGQAAAMVATA